MAPSYEQNTAKLGEINGTVNLGFKRPVPEGYMVMSPWCPGTPVVLETQSSPRRAPMWGAVKGNPLLAFGSSRAWVGPGPLGLGFGLCWLLEDLDGLVLGL